MTSARTGWRAHPIATTTALMLIALLMLLARGQAKSWASDDYEANDNWANATVLASASGSFRESIQNPTREPSEPLAAGFHTIWFKWTAPWTGQPKFKVETGTCGQNGPMPASITAWTGSMGNLVPAGGGTFNATSGVTYSIAVNVTCVGTYGSLQLNWNPPAYADRANAIVLSGDAGTAAANDRGAGPSDETGFYVGNGGTNNSIIWFRWIPTVDGTAHVSTRGSSIENGIGAFYLNDQSKLQTMFPTTETNGSTDMDLAFQV